MKRPIKFFFIASACIHAVFLLLSGFIFITSSGATPPPIRVTIMDSIVGNIEIATGRIEALPEPKRIEKPEKSEILSRFDSKAHGPEKGMKHSSKTTAIPRKKVNPPSVSTEKSRVEEQASKPKLPKTKMNALVEPIINKSDKPTSLEIDAFSKEIEKRPNESERVSAFKMDYEEKTEKRHKISVQTTDDPSRETEKPPQPSGLPEAKGSDMGTYAMAATDNIIEMGDEAIVSFNTKSFIYIDYFESIRKQIKQKWAYPEKAIVNGWKGRVMLRFSIKKSGELEGVRVLKSAGHDELDKGAQSAIKLAAPYDPFPVTLSRKKIHIVATFVYQPTFIFIK